MDVTFQHQEQVHEAYERRIPGPRFLGIELGYTTRNEPRYVTHNVWLTVVFDSDEKRVIDAERLAGELVYEEGTPDGYGGLEIRVRDLMAAQPVFICNSTTLHGTKAAEQQILKKLRDIKARVDSYPGPNHTSRYRL